jgi:clathrin heavy chain
MEKKPMKAEGVLMHRERNVLAARALQGGNTLIQVFDLDTKAKVKQCQVNEKVRFWRWISDDELGIVGEANVYHTNINDSKAPEKVFEQEPKFKTCQIMNYGIDSSQKWCYLVGLYQGANGAICGQIQLFFTEKKQQQVLQGFAASFTDMPVTDDHNVKNNLFCFCERKEGESTQKLHVMEIGGASQSRFKKSAEIQIQQDGDFPVLAQDCPKFGVLFIITKFGYLFMYEVSTCSLLYRHKLTDQLCVVATRNPATDGMIVINKAGVVYSINVEENSLIPFITASNQIPDNKTLSFKLAQRFHLKGADGVFVQMFNQKMATADYQGAANVARDAP